MTLGKRCCALRVRCSVGMRIGVGSAFLTWATSDTTSGCAGSPLFAGPVELPLQRWCVVAKPAAMLSQGRPHRCALTQCRNLADPASSLSMLRQAMRLVVSARYQRMAL